MSVLTSLTTDQAPAKSKILLQQVNQQMGFIPNLLAVMAASPATLESYLSLAALFEKTSFSVVERQVVLLTISRYRNCNYCLAAHGSLAKMQKVPTDVINAVYYDEPLDDPRLEALRQFTNSVLKHQGWVDKPILDEFYSAGFTEQHVLEVVLAITFKTLSNYVNHINDTAIDPQFMAGLPEPLAESCCVPAA